VGSELGEEEERDGEQSDSYSEHAGVAGARALGGRERHVTAFRRVAPKIRPSASARPGSLPFNVFGILIMSTSSPSPSHQPCE
jgi:hypothetical protein